MQALNLDLACDSRVCVCVCVRVGPTSTGRETDIAAAALHQSTNCHLGAAWRAALYVKSVACVCVCVHRIMITGCRVHVFGTEQKNVSSSDSRKHKASDELKSQGCWETTKTKDVNYKRGETQPEISCIKFSPRKIINPGSARQHSQAANLVGTFTSIMMS